MTRAVGFLPAARRLDYGSRLARLRWRRAAAAQEVADWSLRMPAGEALGGAESWVVVGDATALPTGRIPQPAPGSAMRSVAAVLPPVHTLRELEGARLEPAADGSAAVAWAVRVADRPPIAGETLESYVERLESSAAPDPRFLTVTLDEVSRRERPELTRRLPEGLGRILDAGCGAGGSIALGKRRNPGWTVTGVERDPSLAASARERCDRVLEGDLTEILPRLARAGERFDALVFADVLEHLEDPVAALAAGRRLAAPGATLLVSVPNVGHLSVVRDLLAGRFDAVPAGLCDAGHLRWFTRFFLADVIAEAGWSQAHLESEPGAPPPEPEGFLALASAWPDCDRESLGTYQWIATARAQ